MTTFYIVEKTGQSVFTPPMFLEETLKTGFIYTTEGFVDHAKLWVSKDKKVARYIDDWDLIGGATMPILKIMEN